MAGTVKVKVREGWAVYDGDTQRGGGHTLEVDAATADQWEAAGWVEKISSMPKKKAASMPKENTSTSTSTTTKAAATRTRRRP